MGELKWVFLIRMQILQAFHSHLTQRQCWYDSSLFQKVDAVIQLTYYVFVVEIKFTVCADIKSYLHLRGSLKGVICKILPEF